MLGQSRALTRILKIGVKMAPSRNSWSFSIHLYWDFSKSWSQIQKVGVNYSKFGVNETSDSLPVVLITFFLDKLTVCGFICLLVWVEALRPSQQFFSHVVTEPPLPVLFGR